VSAELAQRALALAAAALLAGVLALALSDRGSGREARKLVARPALTPGVGWYRALASVRSGTPRGRSACGYRLTPSTPGVAHPVLPCGVKIFLAFRGKAALTQIVDRGPRLPGSQFELTPALARRLGLRGVQPVRWAFARS